MRPSVIAALLTGLLVSSISPQSAADGPGTPAGIQRLVERWQGRLGLDAWDIEVHLVPSGSLGTEENGDVTVADIVYDHNDASATIRVEQAPEKQIEEALLHELMHLKLEAWRPPGDSSEEEQTVDTIAEALVRGK